MTTLPGDLANRALDAIGCDNQIGDLEEGSTEAAACLRHYGPALRQISRAAHWNFLRKQVTLVLLNDATGQTTAAQQAAGDPVTVGTGTVGMMPWAYEYAWPVDCVKARWVPTTFFGNAGIPAGNIALPSTPLASGLATLPFARQIPSRFLVGYDSVPTLATLPTSWDQIPDTSQTMGQGLTGQTVILSNQPNATLVYTALITYIDEMDPLFQQAFVSLLGSYVALAVLKDKRLARAIRDEQIQIAKKALDQARVTDGDEGWTTVDHMPDWLRVRSSGYGRGINGWGDQGYNWLGWDTCSFPDGSAY